MQGPEAAPAAPPTNKPLPGPLPGYGRRRGTVDPWSKRRLQREAKRRQRFTCPWPACTWVSRRRVFCHLHMTWIWACLLVTEVEEEELVAVPAE